MSGEHEPPQSPQEPIDWFALTEEVLAAQASGDPDVHAAALEKLRQTAEAERETLDTWRLGERSLAEWHSYLCTDHESGEPTGHLIVPASRYGRFTNEVAWFPIAAVIIYEHANGPDEDVAGSLDALMEMAVNDHPDLEQLLKDYAYALPECLREHVELEDE